jgi:hypothetical protein
MKAAVHGLVQAAVMGLPGGAEEETAGLVIKEGANVLKSGEMAAERGAAAVRATYEANVRALANQAAAVRAARHDAETIARQLVDARNALKVQARAQSPADAVALMEARNMAKYGNPIGPTADQLHAAGKTWE